LTEDDVRRIRALAKRHISQAKIAAQFGIAKSGVSQIHRRLTWKSLPEDRKAQP
jgi:IS30 family transposase